MKSSVDILRKLKLDYDNNIVSALIGSGFSKNVDKSFPDWAELMKDVVIFLRESEYQSKLQELKSAGIVGIDAERRVVSMLVSKYGSLELASEYVAKKKHGHESIDVLIEKYIPRVTTSKSGKLKINGKQLSDYEISTHKKLLLCDRFCNIYTTNYDRLIEDIQSVFEPKNFENVIRNSGELSNSLAKKSIVKVHGSLRQRSNDPYEFDNDKNLQYIITKEDYQTYQEKHQAFSFLMRLTMLRGKFCLIGFSGEDPNYLLWLQWMKDVIDTCDNGGSNDSYKVYVVLVCPDPSEDDGKLLFYKNHRIGVIRLYDNGIIKELGLTPEKPLDPSEVSSIPLAEKCGPKELVNALLDYLYEGTQRLRDSSDNKEETPIDGKENIESTYNQIWSSLDSSLSKNQSLSVYLKQIQEIRNRINVVKYVEYQRHICEFLYRRKETWTEEEASLFALAAYDIGILPTFCQENINADNLRMLSRNIYWQKLQDRQSSLFIGWDNFKDDSAVSTDEKRYEELLRLAFSLNFDSLKNKLTEWKATGIWMFRKVLLLGYFDKSSAIKLLNDYIEQEKEPILKYQAMIVANAVDFQFPPRYDLSKFKGLNGISDILQYITKKIDNPKRKVFPYGYREHLIELSTSDESRQESLRLVNSIVGWGLSPQYKGVSFISEADWHKVFTQLYRIMPYPCLYYSIPSRDNKFLKRVGQDFAFDYGMKDVLPELLKSMLQTLANESTPGPLYYGLYRISAEMYVSVLEDVWYELFVKNVVRVLVEHWGEGIDEHSEIFINASAGINQVYTPIHLQGLFQILVDGIETNARLANVLICDDLNLKACRGNQEIFRIIANHIISNYSLQQSYSILYILSFHGLLDVGQNKRIKAKARKEGIGFAANNHVAILQLSVLLKGSTFIKDLQSFILEMNVWNCGITDKYSSEPVCFHIERLPKYIKWSEKELEELYDNMETNLSKLEGHTSLSGFDQFFQQAFVGLLVSMRNFYINNKGRELRPELELRIKHQLDKERGYDNYMKAFSIDDDTATINAINDINRDIEVGLDIKEAPEIGMILDRAIMFVHEGLYTVLSEIAFLVEKYSQPMKDLYAERIKVILELYKDFDYRDVDIELSGATCSLYRVARVAKDWKGFEYICEYWLTDDKVLRFNSIKEYLN